MLVTSICEAHFAGQWSLAASQLHSLYMLTTFPILQHIHLDEIHASNEHDLVQAFFVNRIHHGSSHRTTFQSHLEERDQVCLALSTSVWRSSSNPSLDMLERSTKSTPGSLLLPSRTFFPSAPRTVKLPTTSLPLSRNSSTSCFEVAM